MKFLDINSDIIQLEEGVRNTFRWNWIKRRDGNGDTIGTWCKKINVDGQAYCVFCNSLLNFTALDPELRVKTRTILAFEKLSSFMAHIFSDNEKSKVETEIRLYQSDIDITKEMLYTSDESGNQVKCTIDKYWSKVFNLKDDFTKDYKYPIHWLNWSKPALAAFMAH
ncbi:hypothetical protein TNCV_685011 [Trichonephila clavipes]|nr:hypothetical protein TNCV_685011 [Trichonephila clavipes]